ncbi:hypothetical protein [Pedosphaera parvula]|uniref:Golvesin/Xly CBD-like domain-containing protein n=1 Tax=Pedosphaera parvula (strain Ellin514) TaxID=320771 RepID=B9XNM1_PEDPL|nr:hypothetical protein [Pedosphaera parvula]EEF58561.1 conserved hypothetical protein [Pedosphaera parvula Ellin514]
MKTNQKNAHAPQTGICKYLSLGLLALGMAAAVGTASAQVTYTVFATREGLVGGKTASGHVIQTHDHFVALPSGTVTDCSGCSTYTVNIYCPATGKRVLNVPIYDVGPWNTKDNYWHVPRAEFTSLAQGLPESQAAFQNNFNGGLDEFGRTVLNPAGIDLADGTFWDDLGMTGNDWVQVTYNWQAPTPTTYIVDNTSSGFSASANWATGTSSVDKYGSNYRYHSTQAVSDEATWTVNLAVGGSYAVYVWYPEGSNRSTTAPFIISTSSGTSTVQVNQQLTGGQWVKQGTFSMNSGANTVKLSCWTTAGSVVVADAVKWVKQ